MTLYVRPTCGTWAVYLPFGDGKHADKLYTGTNEDCNAFAEFFRNKVGRGIMVTENGYFGIDDDELTELRKEFHRTRKNALPFGEPLGYNPVNEIEKLFGEALGRR